MSCREHIVVEKVLENSYTGNFDELRGLGVILAWMLWKSDISAEDIDSMLNIPQELADAQARSDREANRTRSNPVSYHPALRVFTQVKEQLAEFRK